MPLNTGRETEKEKAEVCISAKAVGCGKVLLQTGQEIPEIQAYFCALVARGSELEALLRLFDFVETKKPKGRCRGLNGLINRAFASIGSRTMLCGGGRRHKIHRSNNAFTRFGRLETECARILLIRSIHAADVGQPNLSCAFHVLGRGDQKCAQPDEGTI